MSETLSPQAHLAKAQGRIETGLSEVLDKLEPNTAPRLLAAMRHSLLGGGKRLRAILCHWTCRGVSGGCTPASHLAALSLEMVHAYSLIHDDLPAMDDDDLRRGKPTCHIAFDEATALLAGDTLQTEAFRLLAQVQPPELGLELLRILSEAAGATGMASGQQYDLEAEGREADAAQVETIHRLKTGRLIGAAMAMGAASGGAPASTVNSIRRAGEDLGLAFQIVDDLLDQRASAESLGKNPGQDAAHEKLTAPAVWGAQEAETRAHELLRSSKEQLDELGVLHEDLAVLCNLLVHRER